MTGIRKAFQEIQQYGINIDVHLFRQSDPATFKKETDLILANLPDGVVLAPFFSREAKAFIAALKENSVPYVFIDSNLKDCDKLSYVGQDSFQSGTLAARLLDYMIPSDSDVLVLHFAKQLDNLNHLAQREKGFYEYFRNTYGPNARNLITMEIADPATTEAQAEIAEILNINPKIKGIFVTNSQVYLVGRLLEKSGNQIRVIGHDLIRENIDFLKKGIVDFLICQRPEEQGYRSVISLFENLVMKKEVAPENYMSIDIITKENVDYYK